MAKFLYLFIFFTLTVYAQENALRNLPSSLRECYANKYLLERDNRLPHTLNTFIAILRKIENTKGLNMDLRTLSIAILHRFRQDGIAPNPSIPIQDGISPYAPNAHQFFRFAQTLRLIPGNAINFPNNSITDVERCTLHFMLSSSVEIYERGDETKVCRFADTYRYPRNVKDKHKTKTENIVNDVETLSFDEIKSMKHKNKDEHTMVDPNSIYQDPPPNHPDSARLSASVLSKCPVENGVVKTPWGATSFGLVLAGIASATEPGSVNLYDLESDILQKNNSFSLKQLTIENKWFATFAGDLAEVALRQGPLNDKTVSVGVTGNWNSTALPRWYFLNSNDKYEMTTAEIRGDLDGLILANEIYKWYNTIPNLKLSQIFDMYYSSLGVFDSSIRACNRRKLFTSVAPQEKLIAETYSAALLLQPDLAKATLDNLIIQKFSENAVNELEKYVPLQMNKDLSCVETDKLYKFNQISIDLTIILDTNWEFSAIKVILAYLLENVDINQFNSNFTLINGHNGIPMINSTYNILDFYAYNSSHYENITHGFDLPKSLMKLEMYLMNKLNTERSRGVGGARSDIVLIIPRTSDISKTDKEYCLQIISRMREQIPDTMIFIMAYGSKDPWFDLTLNRMTDLFSIGIGDTEETLKPIVDMVIPRINQVPKRLINTQCGSDYISSGFSNSYDDYVKPNGINFYKLHPNYFYNSNNMTKIKIKGIESDSLIICSSREPLDINTTNASQSCVSILNEEHSITVSCSDANFIHECPPLYISIASNASSISYKCTDFQVCRVPNLIKYTISYENMVCISGATKIVFNSFILIIMLYFLNI